jgi:hypothetical protein
MGIWDKVGEALKATELTLRLFPRDTNANSNTDADANTSTNTNTNPNSNSNNTPNIPIPNGSATLTMTPPSELEVFEACMEIHALLLGVTFYTYAGKAEELPVRLARLHALLDARVLDKFPQGIIEVRFLFRLP